MAAQQVALRAMKGLAVMISLVASVTSSPVSSTVINWANGSGDWNTASNWDTGSVPTTGDDVRLLTKPTAYDVNFGAPSVTNDLQYLTVGGSDNSQTVTLRQTGGALGSTSGEYLGGSWFGSTPSVDGPGWGVHIQTGGTNNPDSLRLGHRQFTHGRYELGAGSLSTSTVTVGGSGTGEFMQTGGTVQGSGVVLGENFGASGTYDLSAGLLESQLTVGKTGAGHFTQSGGTVRGGITLGQISGNGTYTLTGGRIESHAESIGHINGHATFVQTGGDNVVTTPSGTSTPASLTLCSGYSCTASYTLDGATSTVSAPREYISATQNSTATFTQNAGSNTITYDLKIAYRSSSIGTYNLNGGTLSANVIEVGGQGHGHFLQSGGSAISQHSLSINASSELRITGGSLAVGTSIGNRGQFVIDGGSVTAASTWNQETGTLSGNGTLTSDVFSKGTVAPGSSAGGLTIDGDYSNWNDALNSPFAGAFLDIELGGYDQGLSYDALFVTGQAHIAGALGVSLLSGFDPLAGMTFDILHADGGLIGTFSSLALPTLSGSKFWNITYTSNDVLLGVLDSATSVDEPSTLLILLLLIGLNGLLSKPKHRGLGQSACS